MELQKLFRIVENENERAGVKDRVAVLCHPADLEAAEEVAGELLSVYDCSIYLPRSDWSRLSEGEAEALKAALSEMSLAAYIVSRRFLAEGCFVREYLLPRLSDKTKTMPVEIEPGLEKMFDAVIGPLQMINRTKSDYMFQLQAFVEQCVDVHRLIGISDEVRDIARELFRAKGFVSYRKKDLVCLKQLLRALRQIPQLQDISLWYDSALHPGENFNSQIQQKLKEADFVLFVVTPALLEPGNYVLEKEYVQAITEHKNMTAVIMKDVPEEAFRKAYPGLEPIPFEAAEVWVNALEAAAERSAASSAPRTLMRTPIDISMRTPIDTSMRTPIDASMRSTTRPSMKLFLLAQAFEAGAGTERDTQLAYELFQAAAEDGNPYAMRKLSNAYVSGGGLAKNERLAAFWRQKALTAFYEKMQETASSDPEAVSIGEAVFQTADEELQDLRRHACSLLNEKPYNQAMMFVRILQEAAAYLREAGSLSSRFNQGQVLLRNAQVQLGIGEVTNAEKSLDKAEDYLNKLSSGTGMTVYIRQSLKEIAEARIQAEQWDIVQIPPENRAVLQFPGGLLPEGVWGETFGNYAASSYRCPRCGNRMYKTVFPEGNDPLLFLKQYPKQFLNPARVFVCPCGVFYAAPKGEKLSDGILARSVVVRDPGSREDQERFQSWLSYFNDRGSLYARRRE